MEKAKTQTTQHSYFAQKYGHMTNVLKSSENKSPLHTLSVLPATPNLSEKSLPFYSPSMYKVKN